jgi:acetyltransferase-like isoleucine patch superfamily enzyme
MIAVERYENDGTGFATLHDVMRLGPGCRVIASRFAGPFYANRNTQIGPDAEVGRYTGFNESCFFARGRIGAFCAIGARTAINPFNHPVDWLSVHEFQYQPQSFDWVPEYAALDRLARTPDMFGAAAVGNDVWMGHGVNVMAGVKVGDGAVVGAGSVVTRDVPPYAVVAGNPARVLRLRFDEPTIARLLAVRWWDMPLRSLSGLPFRDVARCLDRLEALRAQAAPT